MSRTRRNLAFARLFRHRMSYAVISLLLAACDRNGDKNPENSAPSKAQTNSPASASTKADESSKFLERVAGVYKDRFEARRGDNKLQAEHILEVVPIDSHSAYVRLEIQDFWVGRIWGIAAYDKDSLIYDNHEAAEEHCVIQYLWSEKEVTTKVDYDKTPGCRTYHGATGGFAGETFDTRERQDIRYMQRLKDSKEFKEAMEEYRRANPPAQ